VGTITAFTNGPVLQRVRRLPVTLRPVNMTDSAHVQAALIAQGGALSALFVTHPDPESLERAFLEQIGRLTEALESTGAPREFWRALQLQAEHLVSNLPR